MSILILRRLVNHYNYYYNRVGYYNDESITIEDRVRKCVNNENEISMRDLQEIIGVKELGYPYQKVGSITLKKVWLKPYYKIEV
jgi:hypothetical protein